MTLVKMRVSDALLIEGVELITNNNRIVVPSSLQGRIIAWYHEYLVHPGMDRQAKTMAQTLYWRGMDKDVERYVRTCQPQMPTL